MICTFTFSFTFLLGFIANVMSNFAFLPQIVKSYQTKSVDDLSIGMFLVLFTCQLCWIGYAIPIHAQQLWISSAIEIVLLIPIFYMWVLYRTKPMKAGISALPETAVQSPFVE